MQNEIIIKFHDKKMAQYTKFKNQNPLNGFFKCKERPLHQEPFHLGKHATLDGAYLSSEEKKKVQIKFDRHNQVFSRFSADFWIESSTKLKNTKLLNADAKPFSGAY